MKYVSHRGAAGLKEENTAPSILLADGYSPEFIEVDIHITKDDVCVLYHGDLRRTYTGEKLDKTYKELKSCLPNLLSLKELVGLPVVNKVLLDIKVKELPETVITILKSASPAFTYGFTSPHIKPLKQLSELFPDAITLISQPYYEGPFRPFELAKKYNFSGSNINKWWVGPITYHIAKRDKKLLFTYTVDRQFTMKVISKFFPDIVIVSNRPDIISKL